MNMNEQWAMEHIGMTPAAGGCGTSYHDERGDVQDCTSAEPCRACLRRRIEQLEAQRGGSDLVELIRRRYPRMLERGNPLYDAVLADAVQRGWADPWTPSGCEYDPMVHSSRDAAKWADLFVATFPGLADKRDTMLGWFANAMMAMHDSIKQERGGAVVVPEYPENSFDVRMAVQKAGGMADFDQGIFRAGWEFLASRIQPIPADRVLADGEISMARAEISAAFKAGFAFSKDWRNHPSNSEYVNELFRLRSAKGEIRYPDDFGPGSIHAETLAKDRAQQAKGE